MRITCPNCTAHFEIPTELLGRKGRSLKCANCGHSWYQTPQVETIDLAEIMGEEYAAKARADMGAPPRASMSQASAQQQQPQQPQQQQAPQQPRMQVAPIGAPPQQRGVQVPPGGAVSLMHGGGVAPPQQRPAGSWYNPQQAQPGAAGAPGQAGWNNQGRPQAAAAGQGASWYQQTPPAGPTVGGQNPAGWYQQAPPPGAAPGQSPGWYQGQQPGMPVGGPQGQQQNQPAGPVPPGMAPSWYQPDAVAGRVQAAPLGQRPGAYPNPQQPQAMALPGGSMMNQAGPGMGPGQGSVSWMQQPGQQMPQQGPMVQGVLNMAPQRGGPSGAQLSGQSMMGQSGAQAVGDASVSWMQQPGAQIPGGPGQSMQHQMPGGPGAGAVSQMGHGIAAPGQGARSLMDGTMRAPGAQGQSVMNMAPPQGPGAPAVSQLSGQQVVGPGEAARSMLDGTIQAPGQASVSMMDGSIQAPGDAAVSMMDGTVQPGQAGQSMMQDPAAAAQAAQNALQAGTVAGRDGAQHQGAAKAEGQLVAGDTKDPKADPTLVTDAKNAKADPTLATDEKGEGKDSLWSGAKEDEELVDPAADRPDFGTSAEEEAAEEEAEEEEAEEESAVAAAAARAANVPYVRKKPMDPAYFTAGLMLVALLAVGGVLWSQRTTLMRMWPGFAALYEKTGLAPKNPGEGLRLAQSGMRLQRIGGVETLVVKGYISNIGNVSRNVPGLRLQLIDATNTVVQEVKSSAPKSSLDPGASVDYELKLELPDMAKAKSVIVAWDS